MKRFLRPCLIPTAFVVLSAPLTAQVRVPELVPPSRNEHGSHVTNTQVRDALDLIAADIVSISFGTSSHAGFDVFGTPLTSFPSQGSSYFVMSSGSTASATLPNNSASTSTQLDGLNTANGHDLVQVVLVLQPAAGASCLAFDFAFYSEEFPEFVGSQFNDVFIAEIGQSNFQQVGNQVIAPNNFAFDTANNVISINTVFGVSAAAATGTTYDAGTPLLTARTPLDNSSPITITLSIMDLGDSIYDSTALIDNFRWLFGVACEAGADADTDRDALLDGWETNGIDFDNNGTVDLDLPAMGADPMHKDIFVEVDYMVLGGMTGHSHKPTAAALQTIINSFANAPVTNPDGVNGIRIHVDAGADTIMNPGTGALWGAQSQSTVLAHANNLGTCTVSGGQTIYQWAGFDAIKGAGAPGSFPVQRGDVFHYCIFAHNLCTEYTTTSGISRGIPASDFIVSLGGWTSSTGTVNEQAGTFIHELGHGLNYRHGGDDHRNNEPNYLSVMNYDFQTRGLRFGGMDGLFDYSRFLLPTLNEAALNETIGLMGVAGTAGYGTRYRDAGGVQRIANDINVAIDWNFDGDATDNPVAVNVNGDVPPLFSVLGTSDNWANIRFNGGSVGALGEQVVQPAETSDPPDITKEEDAGIPTELKVAVDGPAKVLLAGGKSAVYRYTMTNTGDDAETFDISTVESEGWADFSGVPASKYLVPGASFTFGILVSVPGGTASGTTGLLTVRVTSSTNPSMMDAAETTTIVSAAAIDIKPGGGTNPVNPKSKIIPVAILGSSSFDVTGVVVASLAFGPGEAGEVHMKAHFEDVNRDGFTDLMAHFSTSVANIGPSDSEACLLAMTSGGLLIGDCDSVVPK